MYIDFSRQDTQACVIDHVEPESAALVAGNCIGRIEINEKRVLF